MKLHNLFAGLLFATSISLSVGSLAADAEKPAVAAGERVTAQSIELKDGSKVTVQKDGTMVHVDAAGNRVKMRDGVTMEGKDGTRYVMKNNAIWKTLTEKGTLNPKF
ncbi:MAG: CopK family periplasmic copper-binding protein [Rhodocyclaceae bacterium]